ncbi:hypothetical protein [Kitasatospora cineracea]|uniref:hypothetical protein n=1 Tax=Kitasatospora cineracea TaxID=88074 RepID=UPI0036806675
MTLLLLADDTARQSTADLARALDDGTLAHALQQPYDLSAEEAVEACSIVHRALVETWGNDGFHLTYGQWLDQAPPALLHVLVDTAARAVDGSCKGGDGARTLRYALSHVTTRLSLR